MDYYPSSIAALRSACLYYGLSEVPGERSNPIIMEMARSLGLAYPDDSTSWCALFAGFVLKKSECEYVASLVARDFLQVGLPSPEPVFGALAIFWRESPTSWKGHVGFVLSVSASHIYVLGGNQSNKVRVSPYPKSQLLGYRIPQFTSPADCV